MKQRGIIMRDWEVRAIREGRKTQKRFIIKPQPHSVYMLTGDRITVIHSSDEHNYQTGHRSGTSFDPHFAKLGLHGWKRRGDLLADALCRLWSEGIRGVVCAFWEGSKKEGLQDSVTLPPEHQSDFICPPFGVHGFSRKSTIKEPSSKASGRKSVEQQTGKFAMGDTRGELDGQESARSRKQWRASPYGKVNRQREGAYQVGGGKWVMQPTSRGKNAWNVAGFHISYSPYKLGQTFWVKETWGLMCYHDPTDWMCESIVGVSESELRERYLVEHAANWNLPSESAHWRPSIHMPRWASRITLEIVSVQAQRLWDITEEEAKAEGVTIGEDRSHSFSEHGLAYTPHRDAFTALWESINGPGSLESNPFVWAIEFKEVKP